MRSTAAWTLALVLLIGTAGCGDSALQTTQTTSTTEATGTTGTTAAPVSTPVCERETVDGCTMLGLRFDPPLPLEDALSVATAAGGTPIAVYRTDAVCVPEVQFSPGEEPEQVASRFAYVDAPGIAARRLAASSQGLSPPISGFHISQSYWDSWNAEWQAANRKGVLIEGIAVWIAAGTAVTEPGVAGTVPLMWRRTDSIDASYTGELLMDSEDFPGLGDAGDPGC